ncbi:MAG: NAD(P)-binding protein [Desulfobacterales bacterium]
MNLTSGKNIAVVEARVTGIVSAYLLQKSHQVTLFEKNDYVGGHTAAWS